jgi:hypothetical protein
LSPLPAVVAVVVACSSASAATSPAQQLASRYAPIVALKKQDRLCGRGEPYRPVLVDVVLGRSDVSLFHGVGSAYERVRRAPVAPDLYQRGLAYYVDLPGHPVTGRCSYQRWFRRVGAKAPNAVYAHIAAEKGRPGRLALQYWLYYVFNDYNDKHESDWEMIQLHFDASTVEEALDRPPVEVLYSQHEGAERADWEAEKLQKFGTHPVTYPGAGSHANYFRNALWLGRSASEGLGCDDSTGPSTRVSPRAVVVPTVVGRVPPDTTWLAYQGHWGQRERGFNNGPLGPNAKLQWEQPFTWADAAERERSFVVPSSAHAGLDATDVFCSGVTGVSNLLDAFYVWNWGAVGTLGLIAGLLLIAIATTRWRPAALRPMEQRRSAGQILRVSLRVYRLDWRTLIVVSALVLPLAFLAAVAVHLLLNLGAAEDLVLALGSETVLPVHVTILLLAAIEVVILGFAVTATVLVVYSLRLGEEEMSTVGAYRLAGHRAAPLAGVLLRVAGIPLLLALTVIGLPVAIWYLGRTAVAVPACVIERRNARAAIRRSKRLVGRHFWRVSALTTLTIGVALLAGPLVGALILLNTDLSPLLSNGMGMAVTATVMPMAGIVLTLLFLDLRSREREAAALPARPVQAR